MKVGAEERLKRGSCMSSPFSDLMGMHLTVKLPPPPPSPLPSSPLPSPPSSHHSLFQVLRLAGRGSDNRTRLAQLCGHSHQPSPPQGGQRERCSTLAVDSAPPLSAQPPLPQLGKWNHVTGCAPSLCSDRCVPRYGGKPPRQVSGSTSCCLGPAWGLVPEDA